MIELAFIISLTSQVLAWDFHFENIDDASVYAIIHVESTGDECARREGSKYYGLLQIGPKYKKDAVGNYEAHRLHCDGNRSLEVFGKYMERYSFLHDWNDDFIAILHKGGPTSLQEVRSNIDGGMELEEAIQHTTINVENYWNRFDHFRTIYGS